jgi:hypothetical protein
MMVECGQAWNTKSRNELLIAVNTLSFLVQKIEILFIKLIAETLFTLAANGLQTCEGRDLERKIINLKTK